MRTRTLLAVAVLVAGLLGVVYVGLSGESTGTLAPEWTSETDPGTAGNHHEPAVAVVDGEPLVFAPVSSTQDADECALVALDATDGTERWRYDVPRGNCTIHAVADPAVADTDDDGDREVLAPTTEDEVLVAGAVEGAIEDRLPLTDYGYTRPTVADIDDDGERETVAVDVLGSVRVFAPDGTIEWRADREAYVWATAVVDDVDADGETEVVVADRRGYVTAFGPDGSVLWNRSTGADLVATWMTSADLDDDPALEYVVASTAGATVAYDGRTGDLEWRHDAGSLSAVNAVLSVEGRPTVFATAADGSLVAIDGSDGSERWRTTVTDEAINMMPPPVAGDVDGDGDAELVVAANDGTIAVYDPASGELLATHSRAVGILAHPVLADTDDDGVEEIYVMYADGRIQRLSYEN
ncbi:outer membrane protein assembly factor BamB family protein [Haloarchaeobius iranensis]|uniref:Outer membrane protein assembly factor BamB, contains PQQ-like beta-propeller repeat n=1 Tax=Haloarchaeobius iranensis TaxID=996166 RepID=A0A1G9UKG2_9EURY|nr:PQQ-binding-like beta-propeller repeat protein [Haloarchaeobius iranensis]SDM60411.1 Outer membrane protein assembly factor BamB, contains PQQ-like beta-propeller repeat [Haloarchaeobius iranensis]